MLCRNFISKSIWEWISMWAWGEPTLIYSNLGLSFILTSGCFWFSFFIRESVDSSVILILPSIQFSGFGSDFQAERVNCMSVRCCLVVFIATWKDLCHYFLLLDHFMSVGNWNFAQPGFFWVLCYCKRRYTFLKPPHRQQLSKNQKLFRDGLEMIIGPLLAKILQQDFMMSW